MQKYVKMYIHIQNMVHAIKICLSNQCLYIKYGIFYMKMCPKASLKNYYILGYGRIIKMEPLRCTL